MVEDFLELLLHLSVIRRPEIAAGEDVGDPVEALAGDGIELDVVPAQLVVPAELAQERPIVGLLEGGRVVHHGGQPAGLHPLAEVEGSGIEGVAGLLGQPGRLVEELRRGSLFHSVGDPDVALLEIIRERLGLKKIQDPRNNILTFFNLPRLESHPEVYDLDAHPERRLIELGFFSASLPSEGRP